MEGEEHRVRDKVMGADQPHGAGFTGSTVDTQHASVKDKIKSKARHLKQKVMRTKTANEADDTSSSSSDSDDEGRRNAGLASRKGAITEPTGPAAHSAAPIVGPPVAAGAVPRRVADNKAAINEEIREVRGEGAQTTGPPAAVGQAPTTDALLTEDRMGSNAITGHYVFDGIPVTTRGPGNFHATHGASHAHVDLPATTTATAMPTSGVTSSATAAPTTGVTGSTLESATPSNKPYIDAAQADINRPAGVHTVTAGQQGAVDKDRLAQALNQVTLQPGREQVGEVYQEQDSRRMQPTPMTPAPSAEPEAEGRNLYGRPATGQTATLGQVSEHAMDMEDTHTKPRTPAEKIKEAIPGTAAWKANHPKKHQGEYERERETAYSGMPTGTTAGTTTGTTMGQTGTTMGQTGTTMTGTSGGAYTAAGPGYNQAQPVGHGEGMMERVKEHIPGTDAHKATHSSSDAPTGMREAGTTAPGAYTAPTSAPHSATAAGTNVPISYGPSSGTGTGTSSTAGGIKSHIPGTEAYAETHPQNTATGEYAAEKIKSHLPGTAEHAAAKDSSGSSTVGQQQMTGVNTPAPTVATTTSGMGQQPLSGVSMPASQTTTTTTTGMGQQSLSERNTTAPRMPASATATSSTGTTAADIAADTHPTPYRKTADNLTGNKTVANTSGLPTGSTPSEITTKTTGTSTSADTTSEHQPTLLEKVAEYIPGTEAHAAAMAGQPTLMERVAEYIPGTGAGTGTANTTATAGQPTLMERVAEYIPGMHPTGKTQTSEAPSAGVVRAEE
jgi:hypothetical protein